jgi:hypothetical protein
VNVVSDPLNCGGCGHACGAGSTCVSGQCACPTGTTNCGGGTCVNTQTDPAHCGNCTTTCGAGQTCSGGLCT